MAGDDGIVRRSPVMAEPLENRALLSAAVEGTAPVAGDGTNQVPAAQVIVQLREKLAARGVPATATLGKVLELSPFTGFFHS